MAVETKLALSEKELSLVQNSDWILTKQVIIDKVFALFANSIPSIKAALVDQPGMPAIPATSVPKIFKGENYLQLPYVILDYPRCFEKQHIFAVRTMFWWGNFFSVTLHLSGEYKVLAKETLYAKASGEMENIYVGVHENPWQHHFEESNFLPYAQMPLAGRIDLFQRKDFVKLACRFPLQQWSEMPGLLDACYRRIAQMIGLTT